MDRIEMAGHLIRRLHQQSRPQVFQSRTQAAGRPDLGVKFALDAIAQQPGIDRASLAPPRSASTATIGGGRPGRAEGSARAGDPPDDRRSRPAPPRALAERQLAAIRSVVEGLQAEILAPLSAAERKSLLALARKALGLG